MRLYGNDGCSDCIIMKMLLKKNNIRYDWIDVSTIAGFEGDIPLFELNDGSTITGIGGIRKALSI